MNSEPKREKGRLSKKQRKDRLRMIIMIILAVIMVLLAAVCALYARWVKKPTLPSGPDSSDPAASGAVTTSDGVGDPEYDPVQPKVTGERKSQDFYTILVFGEDETSGLTDTIMVVSYDVTNQQATVMSIPRDMLVNVRASNKQINAVYNNNGKGENGTTALKNEVSELVGFVPDYYVKVNWELVGQMVDAIGGVYFDVPWDMWYQDSYQDLYIDLKEGYQLLNGDQAMQLVRWRKNMNKVTFSTVGEKGVGDVGRLKIQQDFLKAVLKQTLQLKNLTKISQLAELFGENVVSDLSIENLFWFGSQAIFGGLSVDNVSFVTMPYYGAADDITARYYGRVYPDQSQLLELINESLNPFVEEVTIRQLDLIRVSADGNTLSSSTGVLADPSAAIPPATDPPVISEEPGPANSGGVEPTDPVVTDPVETDPVVTDPPPADSQPVTEPDPPPAESVEIPIGETNTGT